MVQYMRKWMKWRRLGGQAYSNRPFGSRMLCVCRGRGVDRGGKGRELDGKKTGEKKKKPRVLGAIRARLHHGRSTLKASADKVLRGIRPKQKDLNSKRKKTHRLTGGVRENVRISQGGRGIVCGRLLE